MASRGRPPGPGGRRPPCPRPRGRPPAPGGARAGGRRRASHRPPRATAPPDPAPAGGPPWTPQAAAPSRGCGPGWGPGGCLGTVPARAPGGSGGQGVLTTDGVWPLSGGSGAVRGGGAERNHTGPEARGWGVGGLRVPGGRKALRVRPHAPRPGRSAARVRVSPLRPSSPWVPRGKGGEAGVSLRASALRGRGDPASGGSGPRRALRGRGRGRKDTDHGGFASRGGVLVASTAPHGSGPPRPDRVRAGHLLGPAPQRRAGPPAVPGTVPVPCPCGCGTDGNK